MSDKGSIVIDLKFERRQIDAALANAFKGHTVLRADDAGADLAEARYAVLWKPDLDLFRRAPNWKSCFPAVPASMAFWLFPACLICPSSALSMKA